MTASPLYDAFAHHIWATEHLIDACAELTPEQLRASAPGTYGPILGTFGHLIGSDAWYLSFFREPPATLAEDESVTLADMRAAMTTNGAAWMELIAGDLDPDTDVPEHGDGWIFHAPVGLRLAQVLQHGNDHRSHICSVLTTLGIEPPEIDLWGYGKAFGRTRAEWLRPPT